MRAMQRIFCTWISMDEKPVWKKQFEKKNNAKNGSVEKKWIILWDFTLFKHKNAYAINCNTR